MVRTGRIDHPSAWDYGGYNEIQTPKQRYFLIDRARLLELLNKRDGDEEFILSTKEKFGGKAVGRKPIGTDSGFELKEQLTSYRDLFEPEKEALSLENSYFGDAFGENSSD